MNFNFKTLSMLLASGALVLTSCNDDMLDANKAQQQYDGNYFHVVAGVALPGTGTRSQTDNGDWNGGEGNNNTNSDGNGSNGSHVDPDNNDDFEYGYDYENEIRTMLLVFTNQQEKYVCHSVVNGITFAPEQQLQKIYDLTVKAELKTDDLEKAYGQDGPLNGDGDKIVHVFAFCNPTFDLLNKFESASTDKSDWMNWFGTVEEAGADVGVKPTIQNTIWAKRSFFMSNAKIAEIKFPDDMEAWGNYADKEHPYILNKTGNQTQGGDASLTPADPDPIFVERAAARLDYRDGSPEDTERNTYPIKIDTNGNGTNTDATDLNIISVRLNRMCLVNMSKNFYYLRRVSDGNPASTPTICAVETPANGENPYVVDTDWSIKMNSGATAEGEMNTAGYTRKNAAQTDPSGAIGKGFNFPFYSTEDINQDKDEVDDLYYNRFAWYVDAINDVLDNTNGNNPKDTWSGSKGNEYSIWRYVTENTIPLVDGKTDKQKTIQSTGIVFKGAIIPGDDIDKDEAAKYMSSAARKAIKDIQDKPINEELKGEKKLFSFENRLFAGVSDILRYAANEGSGSPLWNAVSSVFSHWICTVDNNNLVEVKGQKVPTYKYVYVAPEEEAQWLKDNEAKLYKPNGTILRLEATTAQYIVTNENGNYANYEIDGAVFTEDEDGNRVLDDDEIDDTRFVKYAPAADIAIYRPFNENDGDGWGYYCYYVYWNRHNDNLKSGQMGKNEFATVRNNVYKLSVNTINQIGHPRVREYDPDPFDPNDPDEDATQYLQVNVEVLPWVVRVNNIEF